MDFSFVILTFNSEKYIETCLNSLVDSCEAIDKSYEIFIIDNGSKDSSRDLITSVRESRNAPIYLTTFEYNTGTTYSRNIGLKQATGKHIVIMDSDAYANPEALEKLATYLDTHSSCGMVVPKLIYPDGRFQLSTDRFPTLTRKLQRLLFLKRIEKDIQSVGSESRRIDYAISAFWMFPKAVYDTIGGLDEKIFYAPEDVDYCLRVWKAGYSIDYLPEYEIVHDAQELSRGIRINRFTYLHAKGLLYYFLKHRYCFGLKSLYQRIGRFNEV